MYGLLSQYMSQCAVSGATDSAMGGPPIELRFIGDGITCSDPCLLPRGATMYSGCGYAYASHEAWRTQCGAMPMTGTHTLLWIGDGLR